MVADRSLHSLYECQNQKNGTAQPIMCRFGLTRSIDGAHQQREITCRSLYQQFLVNISDPPPPQPIHTAGVELMREVAFDLFPALPLQPFAVFAPDPPPVRIYCGLPGCFAFPVTCTAF